MEFVEKSIRTCVCVDTQTVYYTVYTIQCILYSVYTVHCTLQCVEIHVSLTVDFQNENLFVFF